MADSRLRAKLRFYFITDDNHPRLAPLDQVRAALGGGATMVQYRHKNFRDADYPEAAAVRELCRLNRVPLVVNDRLLLAKALDADGVHLGQEDEDPALARRILGPTAIVGISVSTPQELAGTDLGLCDYVGSGPVFATGTKADAKPVRGLQGLREMVERVPKPLVAIGGIDAVRAPACLAQGAAGVAVISAVTRAADPQAAARAMGAACGCPPRAHLAEAWRDEFALIDRLLVSSRRPQADTPLIVPPGDDAALLRDIARPVVTSDTQREGVHFRWDWMTPAEVGARAVEVTLSDLAACYARPVAFFVNLGLPAAMDHAAVEDIYRGLQTALAQHGCCLAGGNVSRAESLTMDLFAIGEGAREGFPRRAAARPGDALFVSGPLGLARCGLAALTKDDPRFPHLVARFVGPRARFDAAAVLAAQGVTCVMDVSDGLAGDAGHIARAAGLSIELDPREAARHPELMRFCDAYGRNAQEEVLAGGEDYELLFACAPEKFPAIKALLPGALRVGRCLPFAGRALLNLPQGVASFQHGQRDAR